MMAQKKEQTMDEELSLEGGLSGGIHGPDGAVTHYRMTRSGKDNVIEFGSEDRPGAAPMFISSLRRAIGVPYDIAEPEAGWRDLKSFSAPEKEKLRPIAEVLAMLDGNAFFGVEAGEQEWFESYLPEAAALYEANGGDRGWAGAASFAKAALSKG